MKVRFLKWYNALLTSLIGLLGFSACDATEPKDEYGAPYVKFTVKGTVTGPDGQPLPGIQAEVGLPHEVRLYEATTPTRTDEKGRLLISGGSPSEEGLALVLTDTDGDANGGYFGTDTIPLAGLPKRQTEDSKGWYKGAYEFDADITMTKRNPDGK